MAKKVKEKYEVQLKSVGRTYKSSSSSLNKAISNLGVRNLKGFGILTVKKGKKQKERVFRPNQLNRIFNMAGQAQEIALKQLTALFEDI